MISFSTHKYAKRFFTKLCLALVIISPNVFADSDETILVIGGTGRVGSEIVKALHREGYKNISVLSRSNNNRSRLKDLNIKYLKGDILSLIHI